MELERPSLMDGVESHTLGRKLTRTRPNRFAYMISCQYQYACQPPASKMQVYRFNCPLDSKRWSAGVIFLLNIKQLRKSPYVL